MEGNRLDGWCRRRPAAVLALILPLAMAAPVDARAADPAAGEYSTEGGWGSMTVSVLSDRGRSFSIDSVGANMHTCSLGGEIRDGEASLDVGEDKPCIVRFSPATGGGVDVGSDESCRYFCGARAAFDGLYLPVPDGCTGKAREATRARFKRLYDRKAYGDAQATLQPLLERCGRLLDRYDDGWIRNDLALTQHKIGDDAECRRTLEPLAADARTTDDEIAAEYPPSDADAWLPIVKATRTNLRLCGA